MLADSKAYSGYAVDDIDAAVKFYGDTLGLKTSVLDDENGLIQVDLAGDRPVLIYLKPDFTPATYTVLNFPVPDVKKAADDLASRGIQFEQYDGFEQDDQGVAAEGPGDGIAWFTDPAGNILSIHGEE
jgi:predicted enzyme related to lactoylglutathione lyase